MAHDLIEKVAETDDHLMEKFSTVRSPASRLRKALRAATIAFKAHPVFAARR
jgi:translation elongation factor EF-G